MKNTYGTVPEDEPFSDYSYSAALDELVSEKTVSIDKANNHGYVHQKYLSHKEPNINDLSEKELKILDDVIEDITKNHTASSISELTHNDIWSMAENRERIPLCTIFTHTLGNITNKDIEWGLNGC